MLHPLLSPRAPGATTPYTLGCMNFGRRTPKAEALRILARAVDAGIGLLDTANVYTDGASETIVGEFARGRDVLVATKVGFARRNGRPEGLARATVLAACDESLARLKLPAIDLYYLHAPDPATPFEETLDAIGTLLAAGKIRAWGVSNFASWQILVLRQLAERAGIPHPVVAQQLYNALVRQLDLEYFRFARAFPIHTTVYNPLAGGMLAGHHTFEETVAKGSRFDENAIYRRRYWQRALFAAVEDLRVIATEEGLTLLQLAYAFVLGTPGVDSVLIGPGTVAHLEDALTAREVTLSPEARKKVDAVHRELVGTDVSYAR